MSDDRIISFHEKPEHPRTIPGDPGHVLASMGVYVFSMKLLIELLHEDHAAPNPPTISARTFCPRSSAAHRVDRLPFRRHRAGGSPPIVTGAMSGRIDAYYEANMDLLQPVPPMDLYQGDWPIRTYEGQHPPARSVPGRSGREAEIVNCMLASGTLIVGGTLRHTILFPNVRVEEGAVVENSLLFEGVIVGEGAQLQRCIVDKDVTIPAGERIGFDRARDAARFTVSDGGIVVIPKSYCFSAAPDAHLYNR